MPLFMISESVSGTIEHIRADTVEKALIYYIQDQVNVDQNTGNWNFDFEIERIKD